MLIPRACRIIYAIASDRGGRHDRSDFDPNPMDTSIVVSNMNWILGELIRYFHPGKLQPSTAQEIVDSVVERKIALVETVDDITYIHKKGIKPREILLLTLAFVHPKRLNRKILVGNVVAHKFTIQNAITTLNQLKRKLLLHENDNNEVRLLGPGLRESEEIFKELS